MGTRSARGVAALTLGCVAFGAASASGFFGGPDPTFGGDGIVKTNGPGGGPDDINDVVALPSGELLAAGNVATASGGQDLAVFKYEEDGSLDTTFGGGDGIATADIDGAASSDRGHAIEVQGDGKIVVAGQTRANSPGADEDVAVVRFESDGTLDDDGDDTGFSGDGIATPAISSSEPDRANDLAIDASGRIVVAGYFEEGEVLEDYEGDFLAVRLTSAGVLDADFDGDGGAGNGVVRVSFGSGDFHFEEAYGVDLADDGDVILGGEVYTGDTTSETVIGLARLDAADGGLDTAFDEDGLVTTDLGTDGIALGLVTSDGTVAVAGASGSSLVAARYEQADGDLDPSFANGGILTIPGSEIGVDQISGNDIAIDDAKYLLSAQISDSEDGEDVGAVALTGSGQLDTEFSEDGVAQVSTAPPDGLDRTAAVTAVDDGNALSRQQGADRRPIVTGRAGDNRRAGGPPWTRHHTPDHDDHEAEAGQDQGPDAEAALHRRRGRHLAMPDRLRALDRGLRLGTDLPPSGARPPRAPRPEHRPGWEHRAASGQARLQDRPLSLRDRRG